MQDKTIDTETTPTTPEEKVIAQLRTVFDPEIPVNIYDLGLVYKIDLQPADEVKFNVHIEMTLTSPTCPVAGTMPAMVEQAVSALDEMHDVKVELVWDPPWGPDKMSDETRLHLNMY